jgi:hypothetical protein
MSNNWRAPTSWDEVCRRKAGRDRYNVSVRRTAFLTLLV